jgi:hypothetical protein
MIQAHEAMGALGRAYTRVVMGGPHTKEQVEKIAELLRKAASELDGLEQGTGDRAQGAAG